jgi:hypothetical protein
MDDLVVLGDDNAIAQVPMGAILCGDDVTGVDPNAGHTQTSIGRDDEFSTASSYREAIVWCGGLAVEAEGPQ